MKRRGTHPLLFAALAAALCTQSAVAAVLPEAVPAGHPSEDLDVLRGSAVEQYVREVEAEKGALTEPQRKVDHEIRRLLEPLMAPAAPSAAPQLRLSVRLRSADPQELEELVRRGFEIERLDRDLMRAEGRVHPRDVYRLAELPFVAALKPVHPAWLRVGSATTEGDAASRAPLVRAQGFDGAGTVVGVISDGVDHADEAGSTGDLPLITVPNDPRCRRGRGDEGTALLEIVHDLAPGARLLFSSGSDGEMAFIDSVRCLTAAGANVLVDDLGFFDQPFFEDGPVSAAVKAAIVDAGVSYHSAAGNEANVHLEQMYRPSPTTSFHDFLGGPVDNTNDVSVAPFGTLSCILQWNDPFGAATNDYDLLMLDANLNPIAQSANPQTGAGDPLEAVAIFNPAPVSQIFKVAIRKAAGESRLLNLFCLGASAQQYVTTEGSVVGHPALREAVAVGAVDVSEPGLDSVESYSSEGPTRIFFPAAETRPKPDIVAFDGVSISNAGGFPRCPPACQFFGTSAAAPHSAAVAALLLSKNPSLTPAEIQDALRTTAVDIGPAGPDDSSGAGRLDALAAAQAVGAPECVGDGNCADGNACTADTCERGTCRHQPISLRCDDQEPCTDDTCDTQRGCVHSAVTGVRSVTCWLEGIDGALGTAPASEVGAGVRHRIGTAIANLTSRVQLTTEAAGAGDRRRESRMLRAARRSFKRVRHATTAAQHNRRIARSLATVIRTRLARAKSELQSLLAR